MIISICRYCKTDCLLIYEIFKMSATFLLGSAAQQCARLFLNKVTQYSVDRQIQRLLVIVHFFKTMNVIKEASYPFAKNHKTNPLQNLIDGFGGHLEQGCKFWSNLYKIFSQLRIQAPVFSLMSCLKVYKLEKYQLMLSGCNRIHRSGRAFAGFAELSQSHKGSKSNLYPSTEFSPIARLTPKLSIQ